MTKAKKSGKSAKETMGASAKKLLNALPDAVEHMQMVQNAVHLFEEAQKHASDLREEASKEVAKLLHRVSGLKVASQEARKQAQTNLMQLVSVWHEKKEAFPKKMTVEVDRLLHRVGLHRDAAHTEKAPSKKPAKTAASKVKKTAVKKPAAKPAAAKPAAKKSAPKAAPAAKKTSRPRAKAQVATTTSQTPPETVSV